MDAPSILVLLDNKEIFLFLHYSIDRDNFFHIYDPVGKCEIFPIIYQKKRYNIIRTYLDNINFNSIIRYYYKYNLVSILIPSDIPKIKEFLTNNIPVLLNNKLYTYILEDKSYLKDYFEKLNLFVQLRKGMN